MEETLSISGTVETVVYANEQTGYAVLEVADERDGELYTAVGPLCEVRAGEEVTLHGRFAMHPTYPPFSFSPAAARVLPAAAGAIVPQPARGVKAKGRARPPDSPCRVFLTFQT